MAVLPIGIGSAAGAGGYQIERSLRFNSADSAYLSRTPASAGNRKTWTWSGWVKRSKLGAQQGLIGCPVGTSDSTFMNLQFNPSDQLGLGLYTQYVLLTTQVFRDVSAWYHIVVSFDTTNATANNRCRMYVNGVEITTFTSRSNPTLNADYGINQASQHDIGRSEYTNSTCLGGYLTEINFINGQQLDASSFGETDSSTGVWKPKAFSGSYGTNGFYLKFADNSGTTSTTLGKDSSGNGNNWTPNNFSVTAGAGNDSLVDSPTSYGTDTGVGGTVRGNYCTLNPLDNAQGATFSNGNLQAANASANDKFYRGTFGMSSGKWYWEVQLTTVGNRNRLGITDTGLIYNSTTLSGNYALVSVGNQSSNTTGTLSGTIPTFANGDYITFALDEDTGILYFEKNAAPNTSTSPKFTGLSTTTTYFVTNQETGATPGTNIFNFGQRPFAYTAPSGFKALCTQNLPTPTIGATSTTQANDYFNAVTYTGTGSTRSVTGVGFQPSFVWIKGRSTASSHHLFDAVRGVPKVLFTDGTYAEETRTNSFTSFDSDGFTVGSSSDGNTNVNTTTYVAWNWKANGAGSSNTAGTITSTVSANTTSGFSIVQWTGSGANGTVGHGLGVAPQFMFMKNKTNSGTGWPSYHAFIDASAPQNYYISLADTAGRVSASNAWNNTAPTSSVFSVGSSSFSNGGTMIAYVFAPVAGYSAFGSYTGNGSADGPFVFTNFRPRYLMVKRTDTTGDWIILDTARDTYNLCTKLLYPHLSTAEETYNVTDLLSNGFKQRNTFGALNASGGTYIYAAFAEVPMKYSLGR